MDLSFPRFASVGYIEKLATEISNTTITEDSKIVLDYSDTNDPPILLCLKEQELPPKDGKINVILDMTDASIPPQYRVQVVCVKENENFTFWGKFIRMSSYHVYKSRMRIILISYDHTVIEGDYTDLAERLSSMSLVPHPKFTVETHTKPPQQPPSIINPIQPNRTNEYQPTRSPNRNDNLNRDMYNQGAHNNQPQTISWPHMSNTHQPKIDQSPNLDPYTTNNSTNTPFSNNNNNFGVKDQKKTYYSENKNIYNQPNHTINYHTHNNLPQEDPNLSYGPSRPIQQNKIRSNVGPYGNEKNPNKGPDSHITEIVKLSPYMPKWKILGRVTFKSQIRTFSNSQNDGQVFSIDIKDKDGEIRGVFFSKAVDKFKDVIVLNKVYTFTGGQIKPKRSTSFNKTNHPYEIMFEESSIIEPAEEQENLPRMNYEFVSIRQISEIEVNSKIDVLAVVSDFKEIDQITRKDGQKTEKRDVTLIDSSKMSIVLSLWGDKVNLLPLQVLHTQPVVAIKAVRVNEFRGIKLDTQTNTIIEVDPENHRARELSMWFRNNKQDLNIETFSTKENLLSKCKSIDEVIKETANADPSLLAEKGVYFTCRAAIEHINDDKFSYPACHECRRKVIEDPTKQEVQWFCQKCDKPIMKPNFNYNLLVSLVDYSGSLKCSCWNECGEMIMNGLKADKLVELLSGILTENGKSFVDYIADTYFSEWIFTIRAKSETYMDETKTKYTILRVTPTNTKLEEDMLDYIQTLKAITV